MNNTTTLQAAATAAAIQKINQDWNQIQALGDTLQETKIQFVNIGREIGLTLIGVCGHEQMRLSFYENVKSHLPNGMSYDSVRKFIQLAHSMPGPATSIDEANAAERYVQMGLGIVVEPTRLGQQNGSTESIYTFFNSIFCSAKAQLIKKLKEQSTWDEQTKASVRQQVESFRKALVEIEAKL